MTSAVPPAASILTRAAALKPCALMVSAWLSSPVARIFTRSSSFLMMPRSSNVSGETTSPAAKPFQPGEVDGGRIGPERTDGHGGLGVRAAQFGQPHMQRHLAALIAGRDLTARPLLGALVTPAGGLAHAGARAAAHTFARMLRPGIGAQVVKEDVSHLYPLFSTSTTSTLTMYSTLCTMPRMAGESSWYTVWFMRLMPRASRVALWSFLRLMRLLYLRDLQHVVTHLSQLEPARLPPARLPARPFRSGLCRRSRERSCHAGERCPRDAAGREGRPRPPAPC